MTPETGAVGIAHLLKEIKPLITASPYGANYHCLHCKANALLRHDDDCLWLVAQEALDELEALASLRAAATPEPALFQVGRFTLHSGFESDFKIDCDALTDKDWTALAKLIGHRVGPFSDAEGVPTGGLKLAAALNRNFARNDAPLLIVDDVLTTGLSMERQRAGRKAIGVVIFARGPCPSWVTPLFTLGEATSAPAPPQMPGQIDLPEDAAKLLRDNAWELYGDAPAPPVETRSEWQPIATAPKDGRAILVCQGSYEPFVAKWVPRSLGGYFRGEGDADGVRPTHWIALPASPAPEGPK